MKKILSILLTALCLTSVSGGETTYELPEIPKSEAIFPDIFTKAPRVITVPDTPIPQDLINFSTEPAACVEKHLDAIFEKSFKITEVYVTDQFFTNVDIGAHESCKIVLPPQLVPFDPSMTFTDIDGTKIKWHKYIFKSFSPVSTVRAAEDKTPEKALDMNRIQGMKNAKTLCFAFKVPADKLKDKIIALRAKDMQSAVISVFVNGKHIEHTALPIGGMYTFDVPEKICGKGDVTVTLNMKALSTLPNFFTIPTVALIGRTACDECTRIYAARIVANMKDIPANRRNLSRQISELCNYYISKNDSRSQLAIMSFMFQISQNASAASIIFSYVFSQNLLSPEDELESFDKAMNDNRMASELSKKYMNDMLVRITDAEDSIIPASRFAEKYAETLKKENPSLKNIFEILSLLERGDAEGAGTALEKAKKTFNDYNMNIIGNMISQITAQYSTIILDWDFDIVRRYSSTLAREKSDALLCSYIRETLERAGSLYFPTSDKNLFKASSCAYRQLFAQYADKYNIFVKTYLDLVTHANGMSPETKKIRMRMMCLTPPTNGSDTPSVIQHENRNKLPATSGSAKAELFLEFMPYRYNREMLFSLSPEADVVTSGNVMLIQSMSSLTCVKDSRIIWRTFSECGHSNISSIVKYGRFKPLIWKKRLVIARTISEKGLALCAYDLETGAPVWKSEPKTHLVFPGAFYATDAFEWNGLIAAVRTAEKGNGVVENNRNNTLIPFEVVLIDPETGADIAQRYIFTDTLNSKIYTLPYSRKTGIPIFQSKTMQLAANLFFPEISLNGDNLLTASNSGELISFNMRFMEPVFLRRTGRNFLKDAAFNNNAFIMPKISPADPNPILSNGRDILIKDASAHRAFIIDAVDGTLVRTIECGLGQMTGIPDREKGFTAIISPNGELTIFANATGKPLKTKKLSPRSTFFGKADQENGNFTVQTPGKLTEYSKELQTLREISLPEDFAVSGVDEKNIYGTITGQKGKLFTAGSPKRPVPEEVGSKTGFVQLDRTHFTFGSTNETFDTAIAGNGTIFIRRPRAKSIQVFTPDGTATKTLQADAATAVHDGQMTFITTSADGNIAWYDKKTCTTKAFFQSDSMLANLANTDNVEDTIYCAGTDPETGCYAVLSIDMQKEPQTEAYLQTQTSFVAAVMDGGRSVAAGYKKANGETMLVLLRRNKGEKHFTVSSAPLPLGRNPQLPVLLASKDDYSLLGSETGHAPLYLIKHSSGSITRLENPVPAREYANAVKAFFSKSERYAFIGCATRKFSFEWHILDLEKKALVDGFVSSVMPEFLGSKIYGFKFEGVGSPEKINIVSLDLADNRTKFEKSFAETPYLRSAGLFHVGTVNYGNILYSLFTPGNAYNSSAPALAAIIDDSGKQTFSMIPKLYLTNTMIKAKENVLFSLDGIPLLLPQDIFKQYINADQCVVKPEVDDSFEFVQDGLPSEWDLSTFTKVGKNLFKFKQRSGTLYAAIMIRDEDTIRKIAARNGKANLYFALYRTQDIGLRTDDLFLLRYANRLQTLISSHDSNHHHDMFISSNVKDGSIFMELQLNGITSNKYPNEFRMRYGDYAFELLLSSGRENFSPETLLTRRTISPLFPKLLLD